MAALSQRSSGLDQLRREIYAVYPAAVLMSEVARRAADTTADIENSATLRKCDPLCLIASGGQAAGMEMLDGC